MRKICNVCKLEKSLDGFYSKLHGRFGVEAICKICYIKKKKLDYRNNREAKIEYSRKHRNTISALDSRTNWRKNHREEYRFKDNARGILKYALRSGKISKGRCAVCGTDIKVPGHHPNYNFPLDVEWLCQKHHMIKEGRWLNI